jgi:predicted DNA-binding transcriptional regulator AlpA
VDTLLSKKKVIEITGIPYITIWKWCRKGIFPRPVKLADHHFGRVAWHSSEIEEWIKNRPRQTYIGDPGRAETEADQARRLAGHKGGTTKALRRMQQRRTRRRLPADWQRIG